MFSRFQEETCVPSRMEGNRVIDHMEISNIPPHVVITNGQLPGGIGYISDHRAIYTDL